jgi:hypothetical protein
MSKLSDSIEEAKKIARAGRDDGHVEVAPGLFVGDHCGDFDGYVVHACKHPCFETEAASCTNRRETDAHTIASKGNLYLNMVDYPHYVDQSHLVKAVRRFCETIILQKPILIHCNLGRSRSPSLAMIVMRDRGLLNKDSYDEAWKEFAKVYPNYDPSNGIKMWMLQNWSTL